MLVISIANICSGETEPIQQKECFVEWAANNNLMLLYNPKGAISLSSGCWNTGTTPDLTFASAGPGNRLPDRCMLEKYPQCVHRPLLITAAKLVAPVPSESMKQQNFYKDDWNHYSFLTNEATQSLTSSSTPMLRRLIRTSAVPISKRPKDPTNSVAETTTCCDGIRSVRVFIAPS